MTKLVSLGFP